jgi:hypothetical protein
MNYDLNTKEGMANAVAWTSKMFDLINDGGTWAVPRSGTIITVYHSERAVSIKQGFAPDDCIGRVIEAMGWKIK